ncbi:MAG: cytochrome c [Gloeobacterales cyanobacterium]
MKLSWKTLAIPAITLLGLAGAGLALTSILWQESPYEHSVLAKSGDVRTGKKIFEENCSACHGLEAKGLVGPSLQQVHTRKSDVLLIRQVVSGKTPPMPKFELSEQQMADLLSYLKTL